MLLDNPAGVLPLQPVRRIAVIGPCADDPRVFFGCYAFPNHVIPQYPEFDKDIGVVAESLLSAMRAEFQPAEVGYEPGCSVSGGDLSGVPPAVAEAAAADLWCSPSGTGPGFSGMGHPARVVTRRTSTCRATSPSWSRRSWRPGGRRCSWRSQVARMRSAPTRAERRPSCRHSSPVRRAVRR